MKKINPEISFFIHLAKTQSIITDRFDRGLGGLGFNEFLILFHLDQAEDQKMRRIDLAKKIGMTASGVTRLLLPMEKVGFIESGEVEKDARVRFVRLASGGKQKFSEALERLAVLATDIIPTTKIKDITKTSDLLIEISGRALLH